RGRSGVVRRARGLHAFVPDRTARPLPAAHAEPGVGRTAVRVPGGRRVTQASSRAVMAGRRPAITHCGRGKSAVAGGPVSSGRAAGDVRFPWAAPPWRRMTAPLVSVRDV